MRYKVNRGKYLLRHMKWFLQKEIKFFFCTFNLPVNIKITTSLDLLFVLDVCVRKTIKK